jgi:uncharacterized glyoxalase superfamily protein PhnB
MSITKVDTYLSFHDRTEEAFKFYKSVFKNGFVRKAELHLIHVKLPLYIYLEPDTREETKRLYNALSESGKTIMPLDDTIWGSYFGSCTDKYGINWTLHYDHNKKITSKQIKTKLNEND